MIENHRPFFYGMLFVDSILGMRCSRTSTNSFRNVRYMVLNLRIELEKASLSPAFREISNHCALLLTWGKFTTVDIANKKYEAIFLTFFSFTLLGFIILTFSPSGFFYISHASVVGLVAVCITGVADPLLGARDVYAGHTSWDFGFFQVTRYWNGILRAQQETGVWKHTVVILWSARSLSQGGATNTFSERVSLVSTRSRRQFKLAKFSVGPAIQWPKALYRLGVHIPFRIIFFGVITAE